MDSSFSESEMMTSNDGQVISGDVGTSTEYLFFCLPVGVIQSTQYFLLAHPVTPYPI